MREVQFFYTPLILNNYEVQEYTIYRNTFHGDEEIDEVETRHEAIKLTREYKLAFHSDNIYFTRS